MEAEQINTKIVKLEILLNKLHNMMWEDEVDEKFGQRWAKRIRQYRLNVLKSYAQSKLKEQEAEIRDVAVKFARYCRDEVKLYIDYPEFDEWIKTQ